MTGPRTILPPAFGRPDQRLASVGGKEMCRSRTDSERAGQTCHSFSTNWEGREGYNGEESLAEWVASLASLASGALAPTPLAVRASAAAIAPEPAHRVALSPAPLDRDSLTIAMTLVGGRP